MHRISVLEHIQVGGAVCIFTVEDPNHALGQTVSALTPFLPDQRSSVCRRASPSTTLVSLCYCMQLRVPSVPCLGQSLSQACGRRHQH